MRELSFKYPHYFFKALNDLRSVTYYTSPVDFIVVQYNGTWMPYNKFRSVKAFNHLPYADLDKLKCEEV